QAMTIGRADDAKRLARQAEGLNVAFAPNEDSPARVLAEIEGQRSGPMGRGGPSADNKQEARWKLQVARSDLANGNIEEAQRKLAEARGRTGGGGFSELDPPNRLADAIAKARAKAPAASGGPAGDRKQARAKLKEARDLLAAGQYDKAEAMANEVGSWNLSYRLTEDNPKKVLPAPRSLPQPHP